MNLTNLIKSPDCIKFAILLLIGLAFYFRGDLMRLLTHGPTDEAQQLIKAGAMAYQHGDYKHAIEAADAVLQRYPDTAKSPDAHLLKAMALLKLGMRNEAAAEFHAVIELYPRTQEAQVAALGLRQIAATATVTPNAKRTPADLPRNDPSANAPDPTALAALRSAGNFVGTWQSQPTTSKQGICALKMEVRAQEQGFSGYPVLQCRPWATEETVKQYQKDPLAMLQKQALSANPVSAVLSGAWDKDYRSLVFHVDKLTTTDDSGCAFAGDFTATPFGGNQLTAEWTDTCSQHQQFMLNKLPSLGGQ